MKKLHFPEPFLHKHQPLRNVNEIINEKLTLDQRTADYVARVVGSWSFIIGQSIILIIWVILNVVAWASHWDPYPFILMNLFLSLQAAYTAPVIMMSQNRLLNFRIISRQGVSHNENRNQCHKKLQLSFHIFPSLLCTYITIYTHSMVK
jgi:hypothetical protein